MKIKQSEQVEGKGCKKVCKTPKKLGKNDW